MINLNKYGLSGGGGSINSNIYLDNVSIKGTNNGSGVPLNATSAPSVYSSASGFNPNVNVFEVNSSSFSFNTGDNPTQGERIVLIVLGYSLNIIASENRKVYYQGSEVEITDLPGYSIYEFIYLDGIPYGEGIGWVLLNSNNFYLNSESGSPQNTGFYYYDKGTTIDLDYLGSNADNLIGEKIVLMNFSGGTMNFIVTNPGTEKQFINAAGNFKSFIFNNQILEFVAMPSSLFSNIPTWFLLSQTSV